MSKAYLLGSASEPSAGKLGQFQAFNRALRVDEMTRALAAGVGDADRQASALPIYESDFSTTDGWSQISNVALSANETVAGEAGWLKLTVATPTAARGIRRIATELPVSETVRRVRFKFYKPEGSAITDVVTGNSASTSSPAQRYTFTRTVTGEVVYVDEAAAVTEESNGTGPLVIWLLNPAEGDVIYIKALDVTNLGRTAEYQPGGLQMAPGQWIEVVHGKHGRIPDGMILGDYVPPPEGPEISSADVVNKDSAVRGLISGRRADLIAKKYRSDDVELGGAEPSDELMPTQSAVQAFWQNQKVEISAEHVQDVDSDDLGLISGRRADLIAKKYRSTDVELGGAEPSNELMPTQAAVQEFLQSKMPVYSTRITESGTWVRPPKCSLFLVYMANGGNSGAAYASTAGTGSATGGAGGAAFMFAVRAADLPAEVPVVVGAGGPSAVATVPGNGNASANGAIGGTTSFNGKGLSNGGMFAWSRWNPSAGNLPASGLFAGNGAQFGANQVAGDAVWGGAGGGSASAGSSSANPPGVSLTAGDGGVGVAETAPSADVEAGDGEFPAGGGAGVHIVFGTQGQRAISGKGADGVIDIWGYE